MPKIGPFEKYAKEYDEWFETHRHAHLSEILAIKNFLPDGEGIEIGVGTGRFALPLGIKTGVEPSKRMRELAKKKGIDAIDGVAEKLPFCDSRFDFAIMVTTICFLDDVEKAFKEVYRVLKSSGVFIVGFIDKNGKIGRYYSENQDKNPFYADARFYSADEVINYMKASGFKEFRVAQTIFKDLSETKEVEPVKNGYGEGSFVVIKAMK